MSEADTPVNVTEVSAHSRRGMMGLVAAAALAGGVGAAWWRQRAAGSVVAESGSAAGATAADAGVWGLQWPSPAGGVVSMADFKGKKVLVNFWATWCPPCVEELPLINDFHRSHAASGWQVVGLAVDKVDAVQAFLRRMPLDFPVGMAGASGAELARSWGNLTGGLPFSVALSGDGAIVARKLGRLTSQDLRVWDGLK